MSTPQYFGRSFKLTVTPQATGEQWTVSNSTWSNQAVRITFECEQATDSKWFTADIVIWNFDPANAKVIQQDDLVTLEAGYQSPGMGRIFTGRIFQPLWERADDVNYTLTLHCVFGLWEDSQSFVNVPLASGLSQAEAVRQVARAANLQCLDANLDAALSGNQYPRGAPFSGYARRFFDQIALSNNLHAWIGPEGVHISSLTSEKTTPDLIYAPPFTSSEGTSSNSGVTKYTLIGTPQQTEQGVCFRTLLDPALSLGSLIALHNVLAKRLPLQPMQLQIPFSKDGIYSVAGLRHTGDTRGNDWYTEVTAIVNNFDKIRQTLYTK
jgi:hypothetical protein